MNRLSERGTKMDEALEYIIKLLPIHLQKNLERMLRTDQFRVILDLVAFVLNNTWRNEERINQLERKVFGINRQDIGAGNVEYDKLNTREPE